MCGGFGEAMDADDNVKEIAKNMKKATEDKLGAKFDEFEAVKYKTQVVSGTNYLIKVKVAPEKYVHIKVWKKLPCHGGELNLSEAQAGKTLADNL
jgi:cystatin-A/B